MRLPIIVICFMALTSSGVRAQEVCVIIAGYFIEAPSRFISERGEQISEGRWRSNLGFPNASCSITRDGSEHGVGCLINAGRAADEVQEFYRVVEEDIDSCIRQLPNGDEYEKESREYETAKLKGAGTMWTYDNGSEIYSIYLDGRIYKSDGRLANYMSLKHRAY